MKIGQIIEREIIMRDEYVEEYVEVVETAGSQHEEVLVSIEYREEQYEKNIEDRNMFRNLAHELNLGDFGEW